MTLCPAARSTTLRATDVGVELAYPVRSGTVLLALLTFFVLLEFARMGGTLGLFLMFLVLPAPLRYLMLLLEARAQGREPQPPGIELFTWTSNGWALFGVLHFVLLLGASLLAGSVYGPWAELAIAALIACVLPASLAVLAITRSPLECLRPGAIGGLIRRCGADYWIAPSLLLAALLLGAWLAAQAIPDILLDFGAFYFGFAFHALVGGIVRPYHLYDDVDIPAPPGPDAAAQDTALLRERTQVLNHAYGFISRDNRAGGFQHILDWIERDPLPQTAWPWFLEQMLRWEIKAPALLFAQQYLSRLLHAGETVAAVKLMLRCRLADPSFMPLGDDRALAIQAAEECRNDDLARTLSR
jgi:hypothetical protein